MLQCRLALSYESMYKSDQEAHISARDRNHTGVCLGFGGVGKRTDLKNKGGMPAKGYGISLGRMK